MKKINITSLKQQRIRKSFENGIEIYNPNQEETKALISLMQEIVKDNIDEILLDGQTIIKRILPLVSNIVIDATDEELQEIVDNPSADLEMAIEEVGVIITELSDKVVTRMKLLSNLTPEDLGKLLKLDEITMSTEEVEQLKALKAKAEKSGIIM